jgi:hypothetical protein
LRSRSSPFRRHSACSKQFFESQSSSPVRRYLKWEGPVMVNRGIREGHGARKTCEAVCSTPQRVLSAQLGSVPPLRTESSRGFSLRAVRTQVLVNRPIKARPPFPLPQPHSRLVSIIGEHAGNMRGTWNGMCSPSLPYPKAQIHKQDKLLRMRLKDSHVTWVSLMRGRASWRLLLLRTPPTSSFALSQMRAPTRALLQRLPILLCLQTPF